MTRDDEAGSTAYVRFKLARVWQAKGKLDRALAGYREIIDAHPEYVPAQLELGSLLTEQGRLAEAEAHYRRALRVNPDEPSLARKLESLLAAGRREMPEPRRRLREQFRGRVLLYTDRPGTYGAEQIGHLLMLHLVDAGYTVTCAQERADHHLVAERERAGVEHLWLAGGDAEAETIVTSAAPDLVVFNDGYPVSNLAAKELAARRGIPYVIVTHCVTAAWARSFAADLPRLPEVYRHARAVVAVSHENLDSLRQFFGLPADVGEVIVNGRPAPYFAARDLTARRDVRDSLGIPSDAVVVLTAARLELVKGFHHQLQAMTRLRQRPVWQRLYFVWAGVGTLEAQLRAVVTERGMASHVKFVGERADVPALLDAADVFLLPSEYEGMPLSVMEAMAKGVPTIATAVSGIPEALGDTGRLLPDPRVDPGRTVDEMVATLEEWAMDADVRGAVGRACRSRAEATFGSDRMLASYMRLVERAIGAS